MASDLGRRAEELAEHVLAPLVLGGTIEPVRPLGWDVGFTIGEGRTIADLDRRTRIDVARVRRARLFAPVDTLPPISAAEWSLVAALNDLLQVTNHELAGRLTPGRRARLLDSVVALLSRIAPPRDVGDALARHATFARIFELARTDTRVTWWCGEATFRGEPPAERLLKWRELRRVAVIPQRVALTSMLDGVRGVTPDAYNAVLAGIVALSPLTDLATSTRSSPAFAWSSPALALASVAPGRALALRALSRQRASTVAGVLAHATSAIPPGDTDALAIASSLAEAAAAEARARAA